MSSLGSNFWTHENTHQEIERMCDEMPDTNDAAIERERRAKAHQHELSVSLYHDEQARAERSARLLDHIIENVIKPQLNPGGNEHG